MFVNPFGTNRHCIAAISRFLVHWQKSDGKGNGLWPEDVNDVIQAPGRYSAWATIDCIIALNDVLQLIEDGNQVGMVTGPDPLTDNNGKEVIQLALSKAIEQLADINQGLKTLRAKNGNEYRTFFEIRPTKMEDNVRPDEKLMKEWQSHADRSEELFGIPRTITVTAKDHEKIMGRSSLIEASLLGLQADRLGKHDFLNTAQFRKLISWLQDDFPIQLQRPYATLCKSLITDTLRSEKTTSAEILGHMQARFDGSQSVPKPPKILADGMKQLTLDTSQNIWRVLEPYVLATNSMVLDDCFAAKRKSPHLVVAWEHISNRGHGQDVLVDGDPVATLLSTATIVGHLKRQAGSLDENSLKEGLGTLQGVRRYLTFWLQREIDGDAEDKTVKPELFEDIPGESLSSYELRVFNSWNPIRNARPSGVFSLGVMARGILATKAIIEAGVDWVAKLDDPQRIDESFRRDAEKIVDFFRELFQVFYAHLLSRTFDIIVKERSTPFEPMPVRIVVGNEITHWPGADVGLITYSLLHGRTLFNLKTARTSFEAFKGDYGRRMFSSDEVERLNPKRPLFQTLVAIVQQGVVGDHNGHGAHQGFGRSAQSVIGPPDRIRGAFITSGSNLTDEQSTTIYTWSTAHALSALIEYEKTLCKDEANVAKIEHMIEVHQRQLEESKQRIVEVVDDLCHLTCLSSSRGQAAFLIILAAIGSGVLFQVGVNAAYEYLAVTQSTSTSSTSLSISKLLGFDVNNRLLICLGGMLCAGSVAVALLIRCLRMSVFARFTTTLPEAPKDWTERLQSIAWMARCWLLGVPIVFVIIVAAYVWLRRDPITAMTVIGFGLPIVTGMCSLLLWFFENGRNRITRSPLAVFYLLLWPWRRGESPRIHSWVFRIRGKVERE